LALVPGFSRSGATLCGGMLLGFTRVEAARFSFLLAIPVILGAGVLKLFELITTEGHIAWTPLILGAAVSFSVALAVIHFFLSYLAKHTLWPFIWYKLILALVVGYVVFIV
jgi:undecaprenyl-diphosphatase